MLIFLCIYFSWSRILASNFWQTDKEPRTNEKIAKVNRSEFYVFFGASAKVYRSEFYVFFGASLLNAVM